jgi:TatD DNase family protein
MLIDVHCHLDFEGLYEKLDVVIENAKKNNVKSIITAGINSDTNILALDIASKYDIVNASFGMYPPDALEREGISNKSVDVETQLKFLEKNKDKFICVGEIGLDLHTGHDIKMQIDVFKKVLLKAKKLNKTVIIHSRKAEEKTIDVLEELQMKKVVMHCFCGKKSLVKRAYSLGYYFSIPTNIVRLQQFQDLVEIVDINHLLTETDAPFLSPFKDKRNEPAFIVETIKKIAEIKKMTEEEVINNIWMNYSNLFL